jgi:hypothetical protein
LARTAGQPARHLSIKRNHFCGSAQASPAGSDQMLKADADNQHELPSAPGAGAIKMRPLRLRFNGKGRSSKVRKNPTGSKLGSFG